MNLSKEQIGEVNKILEQNYRDKILNISSLYIQSLFKVKKIYNNPGASIDAAIPERIQKDLGEVIPLKLMS